MTMYICMHIYLFIKYIYIILNIYKIGLLINLYEHHGVRHNNIQQIWNEL